MTKRIPAWNSLSTAVEWQEIYRQAAKHGVLAVVWESLQRLSKDMQPPRDIWLQWACNVDQIINRYERQLKIAAHLAAIYAAEGVKTVVLKGFGLSHLYPVAQHRECGDFDCFLCGDYERGNRIAKDIGAIVDDEGYKHSHITYKGLIIENHRYCMTVRGDKRLQQLEKKLQRIVIEDSIPTYLEDTKIIIPPANFTALFLTQHALQHFLIEGISLRHICDWWVFLKNNENIVDWSLFYMECSANDMAVFADAMTTICVDKLGLELTNSHIRQKSTYAHLILKDIFDNQGKVYSRSLGKWASRWAVLRNIYKSRWKYNQIYGRYYMWEILRAVFGILMDRNPQL